MRGLWKKLLLTLSLALLFAWWMFPLRDLAEKYIAENYTAQLAGGGSGPYVQFEGIDIDLIPLQLNLTNVLVEVGTMPAINAERARVSPWLMGLLSGTVGASIDLAEVFGGAIAADFREGDQIKQVESSENQAVPGTDNETSELRPLRKQQIGIEASDLNLDQVSKFLKDANILSTPLRGSLDLSANEVLIDPSFDSQPSGSLKISINQFFSPSLRFSAQGIPITIPEMKIGQLKLETLLKDGQLEIQNFSLGSAGSPLVGTAKGRIALSFVKQGLNEQKKLSSVLTSMDLDIDLSVNRELMTDPTISAALNLLKGCKTDSKEGSRFNCQMSYDASKGSMPSFSPLPKQPQ